MQADVDVLLDAVVEGSRLPVVEEEDHGYCLTEVVELQASRADGSQDTGIGDGAGGDGEFASTEDEIGMGCRSCGILEFRWRNIQVINAPERISHDEECDVDFVGIFQDVVAR